VTGAAFYCMSSEVYFLGAVGLVNSLRLLGHTEPIYVLDCGLRPAHRQLLEPHVTMVDAPGDEPPHLLKTVAPRAHPADVQVLIDADMIAVRRLDPLLDRAAGGEVVAVKDRLDRFVAEWGELLDLGPIERRPYVSSGLVLLGGALGAEVLELWDDRMRRVEYELSYFERDMPDYPLRFVDQDVLNAVIAARVDAGRAHVLDRALAPSQPFRGLRVVDEATLRCRGRDGTDPYVLHHYLRKPWLEPMYHGIYSRMLARLLLADDVAVRVPGDEVPRRMRGGFRARVERARVNAQDLARWYLRDVIPEWIGARLVKLRRPPGG
jgi:hypothetical protein